MTGASLGREAVATFATRVGWIALEFLTGLAVARLLGATEYGAYAMAISVASLGGAVAALGFDRLLVREVAVLQARAAWSQLRHLLRTSTRWVLITAFATAALIFLCAPFIAGKAGPSAANAIRMGALLVPAIAWSRQRQGALQGLGRVALGQAPELLLQPLLLLALLGSALLLHRAPREAAATLALQLTAATTAGIAGTWLLRRHLPDTIRRAVPDAADGLQIQAAIPFIVLLSMTLALGVIDTLLLGALRGAAEAGPYRAASQMAAFTATPMTAINMAIAPRLAARYAAGDIAGLRRIARRAVASGAACAFAIAAALWILGPRLLHLFGPGFEIAYGPLALLTGAYVFNTLAGISGYLLIMSRHAAMAATLFTAATFISLTAQFLLIPDWGALGAAAGTSLALCLLTIGLGIAARRIVGARSSLLPL